jgi:lysophospholipase L1-like esterase
VKERLLKIVSLLLLIAGLEAVGHVGLRMLDNNDGVMGEYFPDRYARLRSVLAKEDGALPRYIGANSINYMPTPGYTLFGQVQHNADGYRGEAVPLLKGSRYRVLFLGGSTTYGSTAKLPHQAYPVQTALWLDSLMARQGLRWRTHDGVEVINGGLEGGWSTDELNHYLHRFRHYRPDMVVIHSAGNDAEQDIRSTAYTPDMVNARPPETFQIYRYHIPAFLFRSRLFSYVVIRFFLQESFNHDQPRIKAALDIPYQWYATADKDALVAGGFRGGAFHRNMATLIREAQADSADVALLPFGLNEQWPHLNDPPHYVPNVTVFNGILKELSTETGAIWIEFNYASVSPQNWLDDCHLSPEGDSQKGRLVAGTLLQHLKEKGTVVPIAEH